MDTSRTTVINITAFTASTQHDTSYRYLHSDSVEGIILSWYQCRLVLVSGGSVLVRDIRYNA